MGSELSSITGKRDKAEGLVPARLEEVADDIAGYETSKGSLKFAVDKPLPKRLVNQLVKTRLRELGLT